MEEEAAVQALCILYGKDELLLSNEHFNTSLSTKIINFYRSLVHKIKRDIEEDYTHSESNTGSSTEPLMSKGIFIVFKS